jgi:hypothetical protein
MKTLLTTIFLAAAVSGFTQIIRVDNFTERNLLVERYIVFDGNFADENVISNVNRGFEEYFSANGLAYCSPFKDRVHFLVSLTDGEGGRSVYSVTSNFDMFSKNTSLAVQLVYLKKSGDVRGEDIKNRFDKVAKDFENVLYVSYKK